MVGNLPQENLERRLVKVAMRLQFKVVDASGENLCTALVGSLSSPDTRPFHDRHFHREVSVERIRIILMPYLRVYLFAAIEELLKLRQNRLDIGHALDPLSFRKETLSNGSVDRLFVHDQAFVKLNSLTLPSPFHLFEGFRDATRSLLLLQCC